MSIDENDTLLLSQINGIKSKPQKEIISLCSDLIYIPKVDYNDINNSSLSGNNGHLISYNKTSCSLSQMNNSSQFDNIDEVNLNTVLKNKLDGLQRKNDMMDNMTNDYKAQVDIITNEIEVYKKKIEDNIKENNSRCLIEKLKEQIAVIQKENDDLNKENELIEQENLKLDDFFINELHSNKRTKKPIIINNLPIKFINKKFNSNTEINENDLNHIFNNVNLPSYLNNKKSIFD